MADEEGVAVNQLINVAVAEKLSALRTETYFRERASRADGGSEMKVVDELRRLLASLRHREKVWEQRRFTVDPHAFGFEDGIEPDQMNQLADELEAEEVGRKLGR